MPKISILILLLELHLGIDLNISISTLIESFSNNQDNILNTLSETLTPAMDITKSQNYITNSYTNNNTYPRDQWYQ